MGNAYGAGNLVGFGGLNGSTASTPVDLTDALLTQLVNEYVTPKVFEKYKGTLQPGEVQTLSCDGDPIHRIIVQTFDNGPISIFINQDSVGTNDVADFQVMANGFPSVIPIPGMPYDVAIRNDSVNPSHVTMVISSAAG